jgi:hypothetical protein
VVVQNGAFIAPGSAANTTGALSVASLQLDLGSTAAMAIGGSSAGLYDQVAALGNVNFGGISGGTLAINFLSGGFADNTVWQLFSGGSFSGHLATVTATGSYSPTFSYIGMGKWEAPLDGGRSLAFYESDYYAIGDTYKAGQLVLVPEPSTIVFAGIGLFVLGWQRVAKRRRAARSAVDTAAAI